MIYISSESLLAFNSNLPRSYLAPFSHNASVTGTDGRATDGQTTTTTKARPSLKYGRLITGSINSPKHNLICQQRGGLKTGQKVAFFRKTLHISDKIPRDNCK